jgi:hypothetical protein
MFLSSGELVFSFVEGAVSQHGEEDVTAASGECDEGLVVAFALGDFSVVVGPRDRVSECCEGGQEQGTFEDLVSSSGGMFAAD